MSTISHERISKSIKHERNCVNFNKSPPDVFHLFDLVKFTFFLLQRHKMSRCKIFYRDIRANLWWNLLINFQRLVKHYKLLLIFFSTRSRRHWVTFFIYLDFFGHWYHSHSNSTWFHLWWRRLSSISMLDLIRCCSFYFNSFLKIPHTPHTKTTQKWWELDWILIVVLNFINWWEWKKCFNCW